jgi:hypothetical protein
MPQLDRECQATPDRRLSTVRKVDTLESQVDRVATETGFSGVVGVDRGDSTELAKAYGMAHRGLQVANTIDTQFGIASGVKGMTALAVVGLREAVARRDRLRSLRGRQEVEEQCRDLVGGFELHPVSRSIDAFVTPRGIDKAIR